MDLSILTHREKIAENVLAYYRLIDTNPATAAKLAQWLDGLPAEIQAKFLAIGLTHVLALLIFKRYVLEGRGHSMRSYIIAYLTHEELGY